ncbi:MAG: ribonuclease HII [Thermicanus sp.]|nr:ribonuclease HII [Thermicanus sp.]
MENGKRQTIGEIRAYLESVDFLVDEEWESMLREDGREGVKKLLAQVKKVRERRDEERRHWRELSHYEQELWEAGYLYIAGIDEVGRGPLAGPVVSAAVILSPEFYLPGLNDSKQLTPVERERFEEEIRRNAVAIGLGWAYPEEIDQINILNATKKAMVEAVTSLPHPPQYLLIDALSLPIHLPQRSIVGGDGKSISIAAASVVAKVARDRYMMRLAEEYPMYGFERNVGYGTREHLEAIARYGICPAHRRTFAGVKEQIEGN